MLKLKKNNSGAKGLIVYVLLCFYHGATAPSGTRPPHYRGFTITLRHTAPGRTPLDEWPAGRRDLYLTTRNTYKRQTFLLPAGFEPTIIASERPQTYSLDRAVTGIVCSPFTVCYIGSWWGNRRERDHWGDLGVDGLIILGWISRRWDVGTWTGLGWPRTGKGGGRLWVW